MKLTKIKISSLFILLILLSSNTPAKKKILIIGDSISIGYTPFVIEHFAKRVEIVHNPGNAQHTGTGLAKIEEWIGDENWDIIQFNWGLWDLCYRHQDSKVQGKRDKVNGNITYSVEEYAVNLDSLITILQTNTNAKLIFVTTSYVPKDEAGRFAQDPQRYNKAAKRVMKKHNVMVNDIYKASKTIHKREGKGTNDVHYTKQGSQELAILISSFLEKEL